MVKNLSLENSVVGTWLAELRDKDIQADSMRFRTNMQRIGQVMAYEISKQLAYKKTRVTTPLGPSRAILLADQPVLVTVLRAGLPFYQGFLDQFDKAENAFVGAYRKHDADGGFDIDATYLTSPSLEGKTVIVADPMLATGLSLAKAVDELLTYGKPAKLYLAAVIAAPEGVSYLEEKFPDAEVWCAAIDDKLTPQAYIYPGLGDAGDLAYGPKLQA